MRGLAMLSSAGMEALLPRFSPGEQARIKLFIANMRAELRRLYETEPTPELIAQVTARLLGGLRDLPESMTTSVGEMLAAGDDPLAKELDALRAYAEPEAASAAEWVWHAAVLPFCRAWLDEMSTNEAFAAELQGWRNLDLPSASDIRDAPEAGLLRAEFLLFASFEGAREHLDVVQVAELAYLAFEHACEGVDAFSARGIRLSDYAEDTDEERVKRTIRSAGALRAALTDQDLEALRAARLGNLR
jgi:hypothetical protein